MSDLGDSVQADIAEIAAARQTGDRPRLRAAVASRDAKVIAWFGQQIVPPITRGRFRLNVIDGPRVVDGVLELQVELRRDGVLLPIDGHLRYPNPRFRVVEDDGITVTDAPLRALYQQVIDTLAGQVAALRGARA